MLQVCITMYLHADATLFADPVTKQFLSSFVQFTNVITVKRTSQDTCRKAKQMSSQLPDNSVVVFAIALSYTSVNNNLAFIARMLGYFRRQEVVVIIPRIRFDSTTETGGQDKVILIAHLLRSYGLSRGFHVIIPRFLVPSHRISDAILTWHGLRIFLGTREYDLLLSCLPTACLPFKDPAHRWNEVFAYTAGPEG
jgi:hypothetical protein